ncbi:hypothetical protein TYRP_016394 [Tyrophagus putrescentiae]|nr:hypothetical protein TYRP_016394 [Tyrophagus putrescentiae]
MRALPLALADLPRRLRLRRLLPLFARCRPPAIPALMEPQLAQRIMPTPRRDIDPAAVFSWQGGNTGDSAVVDRQQWREMAAAPSKTTMSGSPSKSRVASQVRSASPSASPGHGSKIMSAIRSRRKSAKSAKSRSKSRRGKSRRSRRRSASGRSGRSSRRGKSRRRSGRRGKSRRSRRRSRRGRGRLSGSKSYRSRRGKSRRGGKRRGGKRRGGLGSRRRRRRSSRGSSSASGSGAYSGYSSMPSGPISSGGGGLPKSASLRLPPPSMKEKFLQKSPASSPSTIKMVLREPSGVAKTPKSNAPSPQPPSP